MELLLPGNLPMRLCDSETTNGLTVLLFCDVHIDIGATLNLLQCLCVICGYVDTDMLLAQYNQLRLAPSIFLECTSVYCYMYVCQDQHLIDKLAGNIKHLFKTGNYSNI